MRQQQARASHEVYEMCEGVWVEASREDCVQKEVVARRDYCAGQGAELARLPLFLRAEGQPLFLTADLIWMVAPIAASNEGNSF